MLQLFIFSLVVCATLQNLEGKPYTWADKKWQLSDQSQGQAKVLIFSPAKVMRTRCTILYLPTAILPEGLLSREGQIKAAAGDAYKRIAYETDTLGGNAAHR